MNRGGRLCPLVVSAALLCCGVSAAAQTSLSKPLPADSKQKFAPADESRRVTAKFIACAANRGRKVFRDILAQPYDSQNMAKRLVPYLSADCLADGMMRMPPLPLRGAIYDHFYGVDFASKPAVASFDGIAAQEYPTALVDAVGASGEQYQLLMRVGDCVVRKNPEDARALALSDVTSAEEGAAISKIARAIPACVPNRESLRLSKVIIRGMIIEPLYRLSAASNSGIRQK